MTLVAAIALLGVRPAVGAEAVPALPGEQRARVPGERHLLRGELGGGLAQARGPALGWLRAAHVVREQRRLAHEAEEGRIVRGRREQQARAVDPDPALGHQDRSGPRVRALLGKPLRPLALERRAIEGCAREDHISELRYSKGSSAATSASVGALASRSDAISSSVGSGHPMPTSGSS